MAEDKKTDDGAEAAKPKKKGKMLLFIIIGAVVGLLLIGGGAMVLMKKKPADEGDGAEAAHETKKDHAQPPVYVKLEMFTTNLAPEESQQAANNFLQVMVELKVQDAPTGETIKQFTPSIRNGILRLLSSKKASEIGAIEGRDKLAGEIRETVNGIIDPSSKKSAKGKAAEAEGPVEEVLFTTFIIQQG